METDLVGLEEYSGMIRKRLATGTTNWIDVRLR